MNQPYIYIYPLTSGLPSHSGHHSALSREQMCGYQGGGRGEWEELGDWD